MKVTVLGIDGPSGALKPGAAGTGILVSINEEFLLIDCGPGITQKVVEAGADLGKLTSVFLTHHHFDHLTDLGFLVLGRWEMSMFRAAQGHPLAPRLEVYGPKPTEHVVQSLFGKGGVYEGDINTRTSADMGAKVYGGVGVKAPFDPPMPKAKDIGPGLVLERNAYKVTAAEAQHAQPYLNSLAYRIDYNGKSVVYSGDTAPCDRVTRLAKSADILFHEGAMPEARRVQFNCQTIHSSSSTVGKTAADACVKKLVIVHHGLSIRNQNRSSPMEEEVRRNFFGKGVAEFRADAEREIRKDFSGDVIIADYFEEFQL